MATARLITSGPRAPSVDERSGGARRGVKYFLVDTTDVTEAYLADGLPGRGDSFDNSVVGQMMLLAGRRVEVGGGDTTAGTRGGHSWVICEYQTSSWGGNTGNRPEIGNDYTEVSFRSETITVLFGINESGQPIGEPINNGAGTQKYIGRMELKVHRFKTVGQMGNFQWGQVREAHSKHALNKSAITLPPLVGGCPAPPCGEGQVQYRGMTYECHGDIVEVVHQLDWATDFDAIWQILDKDGNPWQTGIARINESVELGPVIA